MQRHGKHYRPYPFAFAELIDPATNNVIGSGLVPDNDMTINYYLPVSDYDGVPQELLHVEIDPPWLYNDTRATGLK